MGTLDLDMNTTTNAYMNERDRKMEKQEMEKQAIENKQSIFCVGNEVEYNGGMHRVIRVFMHAGKMKLELKHTAFGTKFVIDETRGRFFNPTPKQKEQNLLLDIEEAKQVIIDAKRDLQELRRNIEKRSARMKILAKKNLCHDAIMVQLKHEFPGV